MRVRCPAKINLDLRVGPVRADGFHPIRSWFVTAGLYDHLNFTSAGELSLTCDDASVPADSHNLVWQAAAALRAEAGRPEWGVAMHIEKGIPAAAGLGGGSSDAAHALLALNVLWGLNWGVDRLAAIAATLGSDVPFFLYPPSAICEGRGERVTPVPPPAAWWAVLILSPIELSTPAVFRRFDQLGGGDNLPPPFEGIARPSRKRGLAASLLARFRTRKNASKLAAKPGLSSVPGRSMKRSPDRGEADRPLPTFVNDLEPAAFALSPELARLHVAANANFGRPVRMSGSGSTLFTLFDAPMPAIAAAAQAEAALGVRCVTVPLGVYPRGIPPDDPPGEGDELDRG